MAQLDDFGEKIGGARKDVWKLNGITQRDFDEMNDVERDSYVKKDNVWIKPNWEQLVADGVPQGVAYWQNKMRQSIPPKPISASKEAQRNYVSVVSKLRDAIMDISDLREVNDFFNNFLLPTFTKKTPGYYYVDITAEAHGIVTNKVLSAAQANSVTMEREAKEKLFGIPKDQQVYHAIKNEQKVYCFDGEEAKLEDCAYDPSKTILVLNDGWYRTNVYLTGDNEFRDPSKWQEGTYFVTGKNKMPMQINFESREAAKQFIENFARLSQIAENEKKNSSKGKTSSKRKKNFTPPQLAHIRYTGPHYRGVANATGEMFLKNLKFRGGEFGNWLNENDRQASMNMAYDALRNLADLLKIRQEDVSLNGGLAIAFGARGRGGAGAGAAHYEPMRQVINLTKMSGAGCLAHEWGHALDHAIGMECGATTFASEGERKGKRPDVFMDLLESLKFKEAVVGVTDQKKEIEAMVQKREQGLINWIDSARSVNFSEVDKKSFQEVKEHILANTDSFTGSEYQTLRYGSRDYTTHPDIEALNSIVKHATNRSLPKETKQQICLWADLLHHEYERAKNIVETKREVETDFFKGSKKFDDVYSKYGHGYWQSSCEMFARAFDCYITDKIKEAGIQSDYLSGNADSFSFVENGEVVAAYPRGEERKAINAAFDNLFTYLKEKEILHEAPEKESEKEPEVIPQQEKHSRSSPLDSEPSKPVRYEQLSLDEMLFSAASRAGQGNAGKRNPTPDRGR